MTWRPNELWLDVDVLWFREALPGQEVAVDPLEAALLIPTVTGLEASRQRRLTAQAARRRRRLATRTVPAVALVVGSAVMLPIAWLRHGDPTRRAQPLHEDPPSLTFRLDVTGFTKAVHAVVSGWADSPGASAARATPAAKRTTDLAEVRWRPANSVGLPYSGHLVGGTQLPVAGPDWVTWDPVTDSAPNLPSRLYGNERTIRTVISVIATYRAAHPKAPRIVIGDISRRGGGRMDEHVSHQNGLDVDIYYPRRDRRLRAPFAVSQIDHSLAQDLLDRFVAAGAQMIFVGYSTGLHGPSGVVIPYPNHDNHMHVRFPPRAG